jgi:SAM-dependent methyltransferase
MPISTRSSDAFGQEMWAFFRGGSASEIVERDDGYIDSAPSAGSYFAEFAQWPRRQREAISNISYPASVLDIGCGAGRVALYLQGRGIRVTAIDSSPLAIKLCKRRGVKNARVLPIEHIDRLRRGAFDSVVMFGNNFGLFGTPSRAQRLLKILHRVTTPAAVILAEATDPYRTKHPDHLRYQARNRSRGRMPGQVRIRIRFQSHATPWFDFLSLSPRELGVTVRGSGWKVAKLMQDGTHAYVGVLKKT